ncbi:hypothetical protein HGRIS_007127 [Hohenbuehelia grisea]|uniref:Uncharacterized protein n=1 Tax=Hohenbuehelia grisea TaxID=104357 RepID=A0ABR3JBG9_9AGAR
MRMANNDTPIEIFITGGTGYIGGSVLSRLLYSRGNRDTKFNITTLTRSPNKADALNSLKTGLRVTLRAVVGSNSNEAQLKQLASEAQVVIACADSDDLGAAKAILAGLKLRYERTRQVGYLLHTSGTGVLEDDARGMHSTETIYSDLDIKLLETLPLTQPHRKVDLTLVEADNQGTSFCQPVPNCRTNVCRAHASLGFVQTYIILPPTIYGVASGPLVESGIQNAHSQQIPRLIEVGIDRGQAGVIGAGQNMWPNAHIDDGEQLNDLKTSIVLSQSSDHCPNRPLSAPKVADMYIAIFNGALSANPKASHGRSGFYFAENGEHTMRLLVTSIAQVLHSMGLGDSPVPTTFTQAELDRYFGGGGRDGTSLGTNSRCRAERAKGLGWAPAKTTDDMLKSLPAEVEWVKRKWAKQN